MREKLLLILVLVILVSGSSQMVAAQKTEILGEENSFHSNRTLEITRSGKYTLGRDLEVRNGNAIVITASDVTLDLNGHSVSTRAGGNGNGVLVQNAKNVSVSNGRIGGFNANVAVLNSENISVSSLQIAGAGLAPNNGPSEIGVLLVNTRSSAIYDNKISSVNLGIFVRGGFSTGNRIFQNLIVGGANPANNLLGVCYNPAENAGNAGPRGDNIYNNHIARFDFAISVSTGSIYNIFNENTLASFTGGFRDTSILTTNGGTNVSEGNIEVTLPADVLP